MASNPEKTKRSQKGTPKDLGMSEKKFQNCLFNCEIPKATYASIVRDKKQSSCVTKNITKKALNPLYWKARVADNLVDITPFREGDKFV